MITDVFMYFKFLVPIGAVFSVLAPESTNAVRFGELVLGSSFHAIHGPFIFPLLPDLLGTFVLGVFECDVGFELYSVIHLIVTLVIFVNDGLSNFPCFFGGRDTIDVSDCGIHGVVRIQRRIYVIIGLLRLCET